MNIPLEHGKRYVVTKESDDGTFEVGDHIWLIPSGSIVCKEAGGWVDQEYVLAATEGLEVMLDTEWMENQKRILREKLARLEAICP